jgi:hypothetical protein
MWPHLHWGEQCNERDRNKQQWAWWVSSSKNRATMWIHFGAEFLSNESIWLPGPDSDVSGSTELVPYMDGQTVLQPGHRFCTCTFIEVKFPLTPWYWVEGCRRMNGKPMTPLCSHVPYLTEVDVRLVQSLDTLATWVQGWCVCVHSCLSTEVVCLVHVNRNTFTNILQILEPLQENRS